MTKQLYPFEWLEEDGLMVVNVDINAETTLRFLLDTGSTDTYLDKNILYIEQIQLKEAVEQVEVETANGRMFADVFIIESIATLPDGNVQFLASGVPDTSYLVQATTNMVNPSWATIGTAKTSSNGKASFTDSHATNFPTRLYRLWLP